MKRLWEIDLARGVAVIAMIIFHAVFILNDGGIISLDLYNGFWWFFPRSIAALFLLLVGLCLTLSYNRAEKKNREGRLVWKFLIRGLIVFACGLCISLVTGLVMKESRMVLFGILHLIGVSVILAYPLIRYRYINLITGIIILIGGLLLGRLKFDFYWLLWLGFRPGTYYPADYLPLLPWFSYVLFGIFFGNCFYRGGVRGFKLPHTGTLLPVRILSFLGRHSLKIYLAHLPLIYGIVIIINLYV